MSSHLATVLVLQLMPLVFFPMMITAASAEALVLRLCLRRPYDWRAYLASLAVAGGREYVVYGYLSFSIATPAINWAWRHRLATPPLDTAGAFGLLFLGQEFCYYWFHRASHRVRWFWASHVVHHSSNELNLAAAHRFGWTVWIAGGSIFYTPLVWLGVPPVTVSAMILLNVLYQFWIHTTWIPKLGWLEYVFNTPSHHRVHHAVNSEYLDANYGGILIIFDRLFGTFAAENDRLPCQYGLVRPLATNNPLVLNFHEWAALGRDLWRARSGRERWQYLFGPPGWHPNGQGYDKPPPRNPASRVASPEGRRC